MNFHEFNSTNFLVKVNTSFARLRISKKIDADQHGAKRWAAEFGDKLVCVRYRDDPDNLRRLVTLEIIADERPLAFSSASNAQGVSIPIEDPNEEVFVAVEYSETELRQQVKAIGGWWDTNRKMWRITRAQASAMGLGARVKETG